MNGKTPLPLPPAPAGWRRSWERFWFTPADPTVLGLIRIGCGLITLYTLVVYGLQLQDFMGPSAWLDLRSRSDVVHNRQVTVNALWGDGTVGPAQPKTDDEREYVYKYQQKFFGALPPPPFPQTPEESDYIDQYRAWSGFDLRSYGLRPPQNDKEKEYLQRYTTDWRMPPPAYPATEEEEKAIDEYIARHGADPRRLYSRGVTIFSLWFHVTDPAAMMVVHYLAVAAAFLFTIGFGTRVTSGLTWFAVLSYIHRNPQVQFGMDSMMVILLTYLTIGPSGAALSVDRLLARWWRRAKPAVVRRWYRLLGRPLPADAEIAPAAYSPQPQPSVSANLAIRLLQVHVCFIYLASGLSKLLGPSWWEGTAVWTVLANPEFAPVQVGLYQKFLRWLAGTSLPLYAFCNLGTLFTLAFEIGYAFLIWRPTTRWVFLAGALTLHGLIGLFMGLKTFSLIMLVMNMAFLRKEEADWLLSWFIPFKSATPAAARPQPAVSEPVASVAVH